MRAPKILTVKVPGAGEPPPRFFRDLGHPGAPLSALLGLSSCIPGLTVLAAYAPGASEMQILGPGPRMWTQNL